MKTDWETEKHLCSGGLGKLGKWWLARLLHYIAVLVRNDAAVISRNGPTTPTDLASFTQNVDNWH